MTSPHGHVQPDEYVSSSPYSQFVLNDYETPVDRILLSDNPSSSNTPSAPQHTQGVGTLVCSRHHIDIQTTFSLSSNIVQTESNEINAARLSNPPQSTALASFHCNESEGFSEQTLNHQSTISQASYQKKKSVSLSLRLLFIFLLWINDFTPCLYSFIVMAIHLHNIKKYVFYLLIRARVCRVWIPKQNGQATNFNCLFVDREGGAIQGSAKSRDAAHFSSIIIEGGYYEVKNFYTFENRYMNAVVGHEAVVDLKSDTKVTRLNSPPLSIPRYYFNLTDFAHVLNKEKGSRLLTDVLGRLKAIQPIEKILVRGQTLEDKREFILENIRGEELRITLWGDIARSFDDASLAEQDSPLIVAFAGFRVSEFRGSANLIGTAASVWYFNPDIPELLAYNHYYAQMAVDLHQLPPSSGAVLSLETQINENRRTIREILCMDPYEHKNERFTCKAFIVDYDLFKGWWCQSCPDCNKPLSGLLNNLRCMEHDYPSSAPVPWFRLNCIVSDGKDVTNFLLSGKTAEYFFNASAHHLVFDKQFTDPFTVPPQMIEKLNKTKIFQLRFGAYKSVLGRCEIYVCNIFDEIPTEASITPPSPIKNIDTPSSITSATGSLRTFTPPTPNVADPLDLDQSQIQTPTSQQDTSPQKDTFHDSCHRQSKRALTFNDVEPHDSTQLPHPKPFNEDSSKELLYKDDDNPAPQLSKKQRLSVSSPEKETN